MKREYADDYGRFATEHWWFRARRRILQTLLKKISFPSNPAITEIGTGSGENLYTLYPSNAILTGVEPDAVTAAVARTKGPIPVFVATVEKLPDEIKDASQDAICMFDVLEHTQDDRLALDCLARKLKPGAYLILTVPAYMFLWGQQDEVNLHFRRYTKSNLTAALRDRGFIVERCTYFNTFLFPMIAAVRLFAKILPPKKTGSGSDFEYSAGPLDAVMYHLFAMERFLLRWINFPFGVSVYAEARWKERQNEQL